MKKKYRILLIIILLIITSFYTGISPIELLFTNPSVTPTQVLDQSAEETILGEKNSLSSPSGNLQKVIVKRVIDGDTIELMDGRKLRYIGVDTPESVDPRRKVECFGKEASLFNKELVEGREVRLEKDISETDSFGRLLRYVYIGDIMVNKYLVEQGYAYASSYPPDVKHQNDFKHAQEMAEKENRGLWEKCR